MFTTPTLTIGGTLLVALVPGFPRPSALKLVLALFYPRCARAVLTVTRGGGLLGVTPCPLGQLYITTMGSICQHFFCNFPYFFSAADRGLLTAIQGSQTPPISHFNGPTRAFNSDLG